MTKLDGLDLKGKRVLIRLDLNVSSRDQKEIKEEDRLIAALPMVSYVTEREGKAILMSHLGRPEGKIAPDDSLKPVAEALSMKLNQKVAMAPDCIGEKVKNLIDAMQNGDALLLENLRFHDGEEKNDPEFVKQLAQLGDIYINDAFGTAHREHASVYGLPLLFKKQGKPVAAGLLMQKEMDIWSGVMVNQGPKYLCLGGAKLKEKIEALEKLSKEFDKVYIGGLVYNVVRAAQERGIGSSKVTEKKDKTDYVTKVKRLLPSLKNLAMPDYLMIAKPTENRFIKAEKIAESKEIPNSYAIVDCIYGGKKIKELKKANVAVGFGPFGIFEKKKGGFSKGTDKIAESFNSVNIAVLGGGDSEEAYQKATKAKFSTGGGASIAYLSKKRLPAVEVLK